MRRPNFTLVLGWICLAAILAASPQEQSPPSPGQVFRVTTDLVLLDAQATSKKTGLAVGTLKAPDFQLYEDGVKQDITFFGHDSLPLSVVLLFDLTDSVRFNLDPLIRGAFEALEHLKAEDEVAVMIYGTQATLLQDFTTDRDLAVAAIEDARRRAFSTLHGSGMAYFNEGVFQAAVQSRRAFDPSSRRVLIWLTDNVPNIPVPRPGRHIHTEREALNELFESGAVVSSLLTRSWLTDAMIPLHKHNPALFPLQKAFPPGDVYKYAEQTGGVVMKSTKENIATGLADLIDQLRSRYTLGYRPSVEHPKDAFCKIELKLAPGVEKREGQLRIRTRRGYYRAAKDETHTAAKAPSPGK